MSPDLDAYFQRIGVAPPRRADLDGLRLVHLAHAESIPFENLDVQMGVPISLEPHDVHAKLVERRRGGYCFEQNTLLLTVLRALGFDAEPFEARVRYGADVVRPRTHMLLGVKLEGTRWIADVGFGAQGLLHPLPADGATHEQFGDAYRVVSEAGEHVLQWRREGGWVDLYAFAPEARHPVDFVMANHFTSTWPGSPFLASVIVQRPTRAARHGLRNLAYSVSHGGRSEERTLPVGELRSFLREQFGLVLPADARLRALPAA